MDQAGKGVWQRRGICGRTVFCSVYIPADAVHLAALCTRDRIRAVRRGALIACAVLGGIGVLLYGLLLITAVTAGVTQMRDTPPVYMEDHDDMDDLYEDGYDDQA